MPIFKKPSKKVIKKQTKVFGRLTKKKKKLKKFKKRTQLDA